MKKFFTVVGIVVAIIAFEMIYMGLQVNPSVYLGDELELSADGKRLTFNIFMVNSMGTVRAYKDDYKDGEHNLKFVYSWGGFSSAIGAKSQFSLNLNENDTAINFYHDDGYMLTIEKDINTGKWIPVRFNDSSESDNEAE